MKSFLKKLFSVLTVFIFCMGFTVCAQENEKAGMDSLYTVIYFGATSCGYCNIPGNIENISKMIKGVKEQYKDLNVKTVIVSMDEDLPQGLKFIEKYDTTKLDEIAIGSFYKNELALLYLNKSKIPGVPHIVVIKHVTRKDKFNIPGIIKDEVVADLVGGSQIDKWLKEGYAFTK